jgi:hypothetical protein
MCESSRYAKSGETARRRELERVDFVNASAGRPPAHRHLEPLQRIGIAFGEHLDAAVVLVANVTLNALALRCILDEEPEPNALDPAPYDEATPNEHGKLYGTKKGRSNSSALSQIRRSVDP